MKWYIIFILSSLPSLALSIYEIRKTKPSKKGFYYYLAISGLIGITINLIYTPIDHYESEKQTNSIINQNIQLDKSIKLHQIAINALSKENILLKEKNELLAENVSYVNKDLKKYKKQISQFSVNFSTFFTVDSLIDISSNSIISHPDATYARIIRDDRNNYFSFQTSDNSYSYSAIRRTSTSTMYAFQIKSEIKNGHNPIGQSLDVLKKFTIIELSIPSFGSIPRNDYLARKIKILNCSVNFTINGKNLPVNKIMCPPSLEGRIGDSIYGDQRDWFSVQFKMPKSIYEIYNLEYF